MKSKTTVHELKVICDEGIPACIIDTLPPEYCEKEHIPGSCNACVYEMAFLDKVSLLVSDPETRIIVYGSSDRSQGASVAAEKLKKAGYRNVSELAGGLEAWLAAGFPIEPEGAGRIEVPEIEDGRYAIDASASRLEWTGRNINGRHYGTINIADGDFTVENGVPVSGKIALDMNTIVNFDLKDESYNRMLVSHLMSDDFFDVANHPTALFSIGSSEKLKVAEGSPNVIVKGNLKLRGVTNPLNIPAEVVAQGGGNIKLRATFDIDRTQWGVLYGSGRFFEKLGMHLVSDIISIELFLLAKRNGH